MQRMPALTQRSPAPARDPWIDNARFVLITLVIFGHALEPLLHDHPVLAGAYRFIYTFHMPAFALLSGAVSTAAMDSILLRKILFRLVLPYLVFQALYALAAQAPAWPDDGPDGIATPYWLMWYLPSLACWRLLLPVFARLRGRLWIAVGVALAAGWAGDLGYYLSLSRTLVFFPFFLLGWCVTPYWRGLSARPALRVAAVLVLAVLAVLAGTERLDPRWLYGSTGYDALHVGALAGAGYRLVQLLTASLASLALLAWVPRGTQRASRLGRGSLAAYLLHGFLVKLAIGAGVFVLIRTWPPSALLAALGTAAVAVAVVLCSPGVNRTFRPLMAPRWLEQRLWNPR